MNKATIILAMVIAGVLSGLLAHWTAGITFDNFAEACKSRSGEVVEFGADKVCVRSKRSQLPM